MHRKLLLLAAALLDFLGRMHTEQKNTFRPLTLLLLVHSFFLALLSLSLIFAHYVLVQQEQARKVKSSLMRQQQQPKLTEPTNSPLISFWKQQKTGDSQGKAV